MSIVLIGYRGSGKTTIGKRMANKLWQSFIDTDDMVTKAAGKTVREIFEQGGEVKFREMEIKAVKEALGKDDHVISLGGGAVTREENREALQACGRKVIYLKCDPQVLLARIQADPSTFETRPDLSMLGGGIEEIEKVLTEREPLYRSVMSFELDVSNLTPDEACVYLTRFA